MDLLIGVLSTGRKNISHLEGVRSDGLRNAIDGAELRRQVDALLTDLHEEDGLLLVSDLHAIRIEEVLSN
jgi:hypothetical protein